MVSYICFVPIFHILLSLFICAAVSLFFAWVVSAQYVTAGSSHLEVRMSCWCVVVDMFQCYHWWCCRAWQMSSIRPWFFNESSCLGAVSLSLVDVTFNVLDLNDVDIYWCVIFHHHLCLRLVHFQTLISLSSANSCSICCSSCFSIVLPSYVLPRLISDKQLSKCLRDVSSYAFNVSMFVWSLPVAVPVFIWGSVGSISHDVMSSTFLGQYGLWYFVDYRIA